MSGSFPRKVFQRRIVLLSTFVVLNKKSNEKRIFCSFLVFLLLNRQRFHFGFQENNSMDNRLVYSVDDSCRQKRFHLNILLTFFVFLVEIHKIFFHFKKVLNFFHEFQIQTRRF